MNIDPLIVPFESGDTKGDLCLRLALEDASPPVDPRRIWPGPWGALATLFDDVASGRITIGRDRLGQLGRYRNNPGGWTDLDDGGPSQEALFIRWQWALAYDCDRAEMWRGFWALEYAYQHSDTVTRRPLSPIMAQVRLPRDPRAE